MTETIVNADTSGPRGLGGWLILVGLGVVISPLRITYEAMSLYWPLIRDNTIKDLADPGSPSFTPYLAELIYTEMFVNGVFVAWSLFNLFWFFTKSARFPASFRYFLLANLGFLVVDTAVTSNFIPAAEAFDAATVKSIVQSCIGAAIWVPYTIVSKRVKNTFVN